MHLNRYNGCWTLEGHVDREDTELQTQGQRVGK